jgi:hypothetical protein
MLDLLWGLDLRGVSRKRYPISCGLRLHADMIIVNPHPREG